MTDLNDILPIRPFEGMKYIDALRRRWIYRENVKTWVFDGFAPEIPVADSETIGLLDSKLKNLIDSLPEKAGGFGIMTKFSFGKTSTDLFKGVLSGDIKLVSNTLTIKCKDASGKEITSSCRTSFSPEIPGSEPVLDINFSEDFLNSLCIEIPGCRGPDGFKGDTGLQGDPGTGDGPRGETGDPGADAIGEATIDELVIETDEAFYDTAVVGLDLDAVASVLTVTKAKVAVADSNTPADKVVANPIVRDIEFSGNSFAYNIIKEIEDNAYTDPITVAYPADFDPDREGEDTTIVAKRLSDFINFIISKYQEKIEQYTAEYDEEIKEFMMKKDEEARKALDEVVQKLADREFNETFEYCMNMSDSEDCGRHVAGELHKLRAETLNLKVNNRLSDIADMLEDIRDILGESESLILANGETLISSSIKNDIKNEYGLTTLSKNISKFEVDSKPERGSEISLFMTTPCAHSVSLLEEYGYPSEDFCPDSEYLVIEKVRLRPGETHPVRSNGILDLTSGAYIIQYRGGTYFDSDSPLCGYFVGSGAGGYGVKVKVSIDGGEEQIIDFPSPQGLTDNLDPEKVKDAYLMGPIPKYHVAFSVDIESTARLSLEAICSNNTVGFADFHIIHCARCVPIDPVVT